MTVMYRMNATQCGDVLWLQCLHFVHTTIPKMPCGLGDMNITCEQVFIRIQGNDRGECHILTNPNFNPQSVL